MTDACLQCAPGPGESRWKTFGAWLGLLFFCPCHLPFTITGFMVLLAGAGIPIAEGWARPALFAFFGLAFVGFLWLVLRRAVQRRDRERAREREHAGHAAPAATPPNPGSETAAQGP